MSRFQAIPVHFTCLLAVLVSLGVYAQQGDREEPGVGANPRVSGGAIAPKLEGLGSYDFKVTTNSREAQTFFEQGIALHYAFNHAESQRAFQEAARLDPNCAMAYWGEALVLGPNINRPMPDDDIATTYAVLQKARALKSRLTSKERDLIDALSTRYAADAGVERTTLDQRYAVAMKSLSEKYPDDNEVATLYASSIMNLMPWSYWRKDGSPHAGTLDVLAHLEDTLTRDPYHAGAIHYYLHLTEEHFPRRSEAAADRLLGLTPGAGHLVHMPSHIYMRVGRYADAFESNRLASLADEGYITQCRNQGIYPLSYYPHNVHFMGWAAMMQGRSKEAIAAARKVAGKTHGAPAGAGFGLFESFRAMPLYFMVRFGKWDEILAEAKPSDDLLFVQGMWHYSRGMALLAKGKQDDARQELAAIGTLKEHMNIADVVVGFAGAPPLLTIAEDVLGGELAAKAGDYDTAVARLERGVRLEDGLLYNEPPDWYFPVRHTLGAVLMEAGRDREAEIVYWEDLKRNPNNGWALHGLWQALEAQERSDEAADIKARFDEAWSAADTKLQSSRF